MFIRHLAPQSSIALMFLLSSSAIVAGQPLSAQYAIGSYMGPNVSFRLKVKTEQVGSIIDVHLLGGVLVVLPEQTAREIDEIDFFPCAKGPTGWTGLKPPVETAIPFRVSAVPGVRYAIHPATITIRLPSAAASAQQSVCAEVLLHDAEGRYGIPGQPGQL